MCACACVCVQLADLQTDQQELQRSVQQLRKKSQRLGGELQDTQLHLEGQQARNHQLEKKQRRYIYIYRSIIYVRIYTWRARS